LGGAVGSNAGGVRTGTLLALLSFRRLRKAGGGGRRLEPPAVSERHIATARQASPPGGAGRARTAVENATGMADAPRIAVRIFLVMIVLNIAGVVIMMLSPHATLWDAGFDGVSVVSGVGWSTGLTQRLTGLGCVAMIPLMFLGRVVPALGWC